MVKTCAFKNARLKKLKEMIKKCNGEPAVIIKLIELEALEITKNDSAFKSMVDIGMQSERHPRGSLLSKFLFQNRAFDLDVAWGHTVHKPGMSIKDFNTKLDRRMLKYYATTHPRLIDCAVRSCNYDIPVDWSRKTPTWNVEEDDVTLITNIIGSCFEEVHESGDTREEMVTYLLRIYASAMSSGNPEQSLFYFIGEGSNGKGMISNLMQTVFGEEKGRSGYFATTKAEPFGVRRGTGEHETELAETIQKTKIMQIDEPSADKMLSASIVKAVTGGDNIKARKAYGT